VLPDRPGWVPADEELRLFFGSSTLYPYYRLRLFEYIARLLPESGPCSILDVGAGDGSLGLALERFRPGTRVVGMEVAIRSATRSGFRIARFDGRRVPLKDGSVDVSLLSNVLHHASDPAALLGEVRRVTRNRIVVKDHLPRGKLDHWRLAVLDILGNLRLGAQVDATYLGWREWDDLFGALSPLRVQRYTDLSFRRGLLERVFSNDLEVMFALEVSRDNSVERRH
jgi:SAM-dependent methyltransferase